MKSKMKFYNLTPKAKANLRDGGLLLTTAAGGYGIFGLLGSKLFTQSEIEEVSTLTIDEQDSVIEESFEIAEDNCLEIETDLDVVIGDEEVGFATAFRSARNELGPGAFFEFKGRTYSTYFKEEFDSLPNQEQQDYMDFVESKVDVESAEEFKASESSERVLSEEESSINHDEIIDEGIADLDDSVNDENNTFYTDQEEKITEVDDLSPITKEENGELIDQGQNEITSEDTDDFFGDLDFEPQPSDSIEEIETIVVDPSDFNDPVFDDTDITEASYSSYSNQEDIVIEYDDFNDPLFDDQIGVTESSQGVYSESIDGYASSDLREDGSLLKAETIESVENTKTEDIAIETSDFDDPMFDSVESIEASHSSSTLSDVASLDEVDDPLFDIGEAETTEEEIVDISDEYLEQIEVETNQGADVESETDFGDEFFDLDVDDIDTSSDEDFEDSTDDALDIDF